MVAAGHGVTLLPELAVSGQLAQLHGMQVKTFVNPAPARTIGAVWRKSRHPRHRYRRNRRVDSRRDAVAHRVAPDMKAATRLVAVVLARSSAEPHRRPTRSSPRPPGRGPRRPALRPVPAT